MVNPINRPATADELADAVELNRDLTTRVIAIIVAGIGSDRDRQREAGEAFDSTNASLDALIERLRNT